MGGDPDYKVELVGFRGMLCARGIWNGPFVHDQREGREQDLLLVALYLWTTAGPRVVDVRDLAPQVGSGNSLNFATECWGHRPTCRGAVRKLALEGAMATASVGWGAILSGSGQWLPRSAPTSREMKVSVGESAENRPACQHKQLDGESQRLRAVAARELCPAQRGRGRARYSSLSRTWGKTKQNLGAGQVAWPSLAAPGRVSCRKRSAVNQRGAGTHASCPGAPRRDIALPPSPGRKPQMPGQEVDRGGMRAPLGGCDVTAPPCTTGNSQGSNCTVVHCGSRVSVQVAEPEYKQKKSLQVGTRLTRGSSLERRSQTHLALSVRSQVEAARGELGFLCRRTLSDPSTPPRWTQRGAPVRLSTSSISDGHGCSAYVNADFNSGPPMGLWSGEAQPRPAQLQTCAAQPNIQTEPGRHTRQATEPCIYKIQRRGDVSSFQQAPGSPTLIDTVKGIWEEEEEHEELIQRRRAESHVARTTHGQTPLSILSSAEVFTARVRRGGVATVPRRISRRFGRLSGVGGGTNICAAQRRLRFTSPRTLSRPDATRGRARPVAGNRTSPGGPGRACSPANSC
ncbi:hypothetical protein P4O66_008171 [Electrophorus voltai]|uniref:Uncharacterized protein n=1 Tax=Electrophorus voltai TaxID=2609070 RepID=A0AAD8ZGX4_9TELE|nr:hypothetical protein P4O66_008171 [Electrophorus voltai]